MGFTIFTPEPVFPHNFHPGPEFSLVKALLGYEWRLESPLNCMIIKFVSLINRLFKIFDSLPISYDWKIYI